MAPDAKLVMIIMVAAVLAVAAVAFSVNPDEQNSLSKRNDVLLSLPPVMSRWVRLRRRKKVAFPGANAVDMDPAPLNKKKLVKRRKKKQTMPNFKTDMFPLDVANAASDVDAMAMDPSHSRSS